LIQINSSSHTLMSSLLWLLGLFWSGNLIMLLTLGWSSIVRQIWSVSIVGISWRNSSHLTIIKSCSDLGLQS